MTQLTKREQIAAMVLQGYVSSPDYAIVKLSPDEWGEHRMNMAIGATELADSLLKHLAETEPVVMTKEDEEFKARLKADIDLSSLLNKEAENDIADHVEKAVNGLNEEKSERVYDLYIKQDLKDFHLDSFRARKAKESNTDSPGSRPIDAPGPKPMDAKEICEWVMRCYESGLAPSSLAYYINILVQYEVNKVKR